MATVTTYGVKLVYRKNHAVSEKNSTDIKAETSVADGTKESDYYIKIIIQYCTYWEKKEGSKTIQFNNIPFQ